jgi:hypothetical protein
VAKKHPDTQTEQSRPWDGRPPGWARTLFVVVGLLLLAVGAFSMYDGDYLFSASARVFVRLPGMLPGQYYFFSIGWVFLGLVLALFGLGMLHPAFRRAIAAPWRELKSAAGFALVLLLFAFSMFPWQQPDTPTYEHGSKMVFYLLFAGSGLTFFLAGAYRKLAFLDRPVERAYRWVMDLGKWRFMLLVGSFTFIVANLISYFAFEHLPHIQDSIAQVFQARIFASGRLWLPSPKFPDFFDYTHIINNGQWYSQYLFLHSLLMVPLAFVRMEWLVNPLLGALTVPLIYVLGRDLYGERTGRMAGVLACLTPFIFDMSAEFMNHASALLFTVLFLIFFFRTTRTGTHHPLRQQFPDPKTQSPASRIPDPGPQTPFRWYYPLLAGVALGLVANVRPYTAFAFGAPFAAYGVYLAVREPGRYVPRFALMVLACAALTSLEFVYNWLTNGDPMLFGYVVKWGPGHEIGFGKSGWGAIHTPFRGMVNTGNSWNQVNKFLFEWPIPSSLLLLALFASRTRNRHDWLLLAGFLCLSVAFFFYWFHNVCFGPRFLYESSASLVILTVRGAEELGNLLRRVFRVQVEDARVGTFVRRLWPVLTLVMLGVGLQPLMRSYHMYAGVNRNLLRTVKRAGLTNALVFCRHLGHGFSANRLDLQGDVVYAKDFGMLNSALTIAYPGRQCYYGNEDTLRSLDGIEFPGSQLERALTEMAAYATDSLSAGYKTVIWPFKDIAPPLPPSGDSGPVVTDFRDISREIFTGRKTVEDYLPALCCWIIGDEREHLRIFSFMNDLQNLIAGDYKFTLLSVTSEGTGAVFDLSTATGDEMMMPDQPSAVPVR